MPSETLAQDLGAPSFNDVSNQTQTPIPGSGHDYQHLLGETVNFSNGSVSFKITFSLPKSRGITLPFAWSYNSAGAHPLNMVNGNQPIWDAYWLQSGPVKDGWNESEGTPFATMAIWSYAPPPNQYQTFASCNVESGLTFTDPSGTMHNLGVGAVATSTTASGYIQVCGTQNYVPPNNDGQVAGIPDPNTAKNNLAGISPQTGSLAVQDKEGTIYLFNTGGYTPSNGPITVTPYSIEDRNGNIIGTSVDSAGRQTVKSLAGGALQVGNLTYTPSWSTTTVNYTIVPVGAFQQGGVNCFSVPSTVSGTRQILSALELPNGQSYSFQYDSKYGTLKEIDYPDGGWVKYTWTTLSNQNEIAIYAGMQQNTAPDGSFYYTPKNSACGEIYQTPVLSSRTVSFDGTNVAQTQAFAYSTNWNTAPDGTISGWSQKTTTVTTTDNTLGLSATTKYTYAYVVPPYQPYSSGVAGAQIPVESQIDYYDWGKSTPATTVQKTWADQFTMTSETTTLNATGKISGAIYTYGSASNGVATTAAFKYLLEKDEYDYGTGALSSRTPTKKTIYAYSCCRILPDIHSPYTTTGLSVPITLPPLLANATLEDGAGNVLALTKYAYDETAPTTVTATEHDDASYGTGMTVRGNLTSITRCLNGTCTSGSKTTYTYDITGQPTSMTDACGNATCGDIAGSSHTTTFSFTDSPSGGNPAGNSNAYLTGLTNALGQQSSFQYDYALGYLTKSTDVNTQSTTYQYDDPLDRPSEVDFPDNGKTSYAYDDSGKNITTSVLINGASLAKTTVAHRDGMFHTIKTQLTSDPEGTVSVDTTYDGEGRVHTVSNPYRGTGPAPVTTYSYDAFGRKIKVLEQDSVNSVQSCYDGVASSPAVGYCNSSQLGSANSGTWVDSTDEKGNHWERAYDYFGRLNKVLEPNGSAQTPSMETDYTYDLLNNLVAVNQGAGARTRSFSYDKLSRLIQAFNPEAGWVCYGTTGGAKANGSNCTSGYDLNGNLSAKTDARGVTTSYGYDSLNRLLSKTYSNAPAGSLSSCFRFDNQAPGAHGNGRLWFEWTQSGSCPANPPSSPPSGSQSSRIYGTYDVMGRLASEQQCVAGYCTSASVPAAPTANCTTLSGNSGLQYCYDLAGNLLAFSSGVTTAAAGSYPQAAMTFSQTVDAADRLATITSSWSDATHPATLFTAESYWASGALSGWLLGANLWTAKTYDSRLHTCQQASAHGSLPSLTCPD